MLSPKEKLFVDAFQKKLIDEPDVFDLDLSLVNSFILWSDATIKNDYENRKPILSISNNLKRKCAYIITKKPDDEELVRACADTIWKLRLFEAQNRQLDSYLLYLEKNRVPKDKFYQPKRKQFWKIGIIQALQKMIDGDLEILSISLPPGTGKGQRYDDELLTPTGFKKFRDLKVGDKVISGTGNVSKVLGIYPKPKMPVYELTFDDGSKVKCSQDHIWHVQTRDDRVRGNKYRDVELKDMLHNFRVENDKRANYSLDYVPKIDCFGKKELLLDPYLVGVLIGDGCLCGDNGVKFSTPDDEIIQSVQNAVGDEFKITYRGGYDYNIVNKSRKRTNVIKEKLCTLGLFGCHSYEKFIPKDYLYASYNDRLELLRGLMDTDGYSDGKAAVFSTSSERLAKDVCELAHSLGGYCSISRKTNCGYKSAGGEFVKCRDAFNLTIQFSANHPNPFKLKRKADKYNPKRTIWRRFITNIEYVCDEETVCIYIDDPSHLYITNDYVITHNTTMSKFFISAIMGWNPEGYNLFFSHSNDITRMYYDGVLNIITDHSEYTWSEIFPGLKVNQQNAKMQQFNLGSYKPFPSLQCTSRNSNNAGVVRCSDFLLVDDLVSGIEEALNKAQLDKLWDKYRVDARQRKVDGCREIHIATRWSTVDVIGRLQALYADTDKKCEFIAVPDIDPETGRSNFEYDYNGFSAEFFHDQELAMDEISYRCLYRQDPIEREGLLYPEDELRRYVTLPNQEPDAVIGVCDTKSTGIDDMVLPVMYKYDDDYYMEACVCDDNADFGVQIAKLSEIIVEHNMQQCEFESNAGGDRLARDVALEVQKQGGRCNITSKPTETNKETRIIVNSDWVKKHVLFKDKELYSKKSDYGRFMSKLTTHSVVGRNRTDDVPDCLANFALFVTRSLYRRKTRIMKSPI